MKRIISITLCAISIYGLLSSAAAENLLSLKFGPAWPQALLSTGSASWDAGLEYGIIVDKKVGFGIATDFLWNVDSKEAKDSSGQHYTTISEKKTFMFPLMGFFQLDPAPDLIVHPIVRFQVGYNSMIYKYKQQLAGTESKPLSPYFYGLIIKGGIDGVYNLGEHSGMFLGLEYQWADMKTASNTGGLFDKRDMSAVGIHIGFRVIM
jgi:hypothetical protein